MDDSKFRTLLENLRYKACTAADIVFLRRRVSGRDKDGPKWTEPQFRNVSVICTYNAIRDKLNELGCIRFAKETRQDLQQFNSIDKLKTSHEETNLPRNLSKKLVDPLRKNDTLHPNDQHYVWNMAPSDTSNHPVDPTNFFWVRGYRIPSL